MSKKKSIKDTIVSSPENPESISRRKVLKKAAYVAPAIIVLGVLSPIDAVALPSGDPPDPPPSENPLSPFYQPLKKDDE